MTCSGRAIDCRASAVHARQAPPRSGMPALRCDPLTAHPPCRRASSRCACIERHPYWRTRLLGGRRARPRGWMQADAPRTPALPDGCLFRASSLPAAHAVDRRLHVPGMSISTPSCAVGCGQARSTDGAPSTLPARVRCESAGRAEVDAMPSTRCVAPESSEARCAICETLWVPVSARAASAERACPSRLASMASVHRADTGVAPRAAFHRCMWHRCPRNSHAT